MEMLYRYVWLKGREIRKLMKLDYNIASVGRKKVRKKLLDYPHL